MPRQDTCLNRKKLPSADQWRNADILAVLSLSVFNEQNTWSQILADEKVLLGSGLDWMIMICIIWSKNQVSHTESELCSESSVAESVQPIITAKCENRNYPFIRMDAEFSQVYNKSCTSRDLMTWVTLWMNIIDVIRVIILFPLRKERMAEWYENCHL
jgi:hypothetical protein